MSTTKAESRNIERWARAQERATILAAIEREAATWLPESQVYASRITAAITALPVLDAIPTAPPGTPRADRARLAR